MEQQRVRIDDNEELRVANSAQLARKALAVCFSGGMDSYIAYHYAIQEKGYDPDDIIALNFNIGQPYADKEKKALDNLNVPYTTVDVGLIKPEFNNVPDEKNYIIPGRNMVFASIGASLAERVWIMGMKYEDHELMYDKNSTFFKLASVALSQAIGSPTVVESPFSDMTKTDIIEWAKDHDLKELHETTSCYHPTAHRCGECSLCFKRYIAMEACGLHEDFDKDPRDSEEAKRLIEVYKDALARNDFSHYQRDRIEETFNILGVKL